MLPFLSFALCSWEHLLQANLLLKVCSAGSLLWHHMHTHILKICLLKNITMQQYIFPPLVAILKDHLSSKASHGASWDFGWGLIIDQLFPLPNTVSFSSFPQMLTSLDHVPLFHTFCFGGISRQISGFYLQIINTNHCEPCSFMPA